MLKDYLSVIPAVIVAAAVAISFPAIPAAVHQSASAAPTYAASKASVDTCRKKVQTEEAASYAASADLSQCQDGTYYGQGQGFRSIIRVKVVIKNHKIVKIEVISSGDDAAYFNRAQAGIIPKMIKKQSISVDTVSGATYSSNGIIKAVEDALNQAKGKKAAKVKTPKQQDKPAKSEEDKEVEHDPELDDAVYTDGVYTGSADGYASVIKVEVTVKDGKIKGIKILEQNDDESYFRKAKAVISRIISGQTTTVDTVSGATYSSKGIIEAVEEALKKAIQDSSEADGTDQDDSTDTSDDSDAPEETDVPEQVIVTWADGTWQGSAIGYNPTYPIVLNVQVVSGKIKQITVVSHYETYSYFKKAKDMFTRIISAQSTSVDTVSCATYTSKGILDAVNQALEQAAAEASSKGGSK